MYDRLEAGGRDSLGEADPQSQRDSEQGANGASGRACAGYDAMNLDAGRGDAPSHRLHGAPKLNFSVSLDSFVTFCLIQLSSGDGDSQPDCTESAFETPSA